MSELAHRDEELRLRLLKILESGEAEWTQRNLSKSLGISLGRTNYCVRTLVSEGYVQIRRLKNSGNKAAHSYTLTPEGMEEQFRLLIHFLSRKLREYDALRKEIAEINQELAQKGGRGLQKDGDSK